MSELKACIAILTWVRTRGDVYYAGIDAGNSILATHEDFVRACPPAAERRVEQAGATDEFEWIHGKRAFGSGQHALPAIRAKWDFTAGGPKCQFLVVLAAVGATSSAANGLSCTAFRFESGEGAHEFMHAQPTLAQSARASSHLPGVSGPLNISSPAFPIDATGVVGVLLSLCLSLYGVKDFAAMLRDPLVASAVPSYYGQMPIFRAARGL